MTERERPGDDDAPAVTGQPMADAEAEAVWGDDAPRDGGNSYPADGVSPDRGSSAPRD